MSIEYIQDDDYKGRLDLALWRRIIAHARPYRFQLIGLGLSGVVIAIIDALFPLFTGLLIDEAVAEGLSPRLYALAAGYSVLLVVFAVCVWCFIIIAGQTATGIACDLRRAGFSRLQDLSFSYFDVRPVGWLVTRLTSDCSKLSSLIPWFMLDLVWGNCLIAGIIILMFWLYWPLAIVVLLIVPPLAVVTVFFQRRLLESSRLVRKTNSQMTAGFNEAIMGVRTTKTLVREAENLSEFQVLSTSMFRHSMRNALQSAVYLPLVVAIGSTGVALSLWRGGVTVESVVGAEVASELTIGKLVAFMQYAALLYMPIQELARRFTELQSAQAAAERIQGLLDTEPAIRDTREVRDAMIENEIEVESGAEDDFASERDDRDAERDGREAGRAGASAGESARRRERHGLAIDGHDDRIATIEFRDVSFWYKEGEPVLRNLDLTVRAGQTVALVGPTGGGKSTIVSLAARFYEPSLGEILINGVEYRRRSLHWLQSSLGVVLQAPHLFSGTIRENIRYGRLDASDEEIEAAARMVNAHDFIMAEEDGYEAEVGEGGSRLSTGQRQLVSLARAVLADPQIFVMDEATSSVDTETEQRIQDAIDAVLSGRIAFVIAHRLSTIRSADVILVIDGGVIVERGTHEELMDARGRYHALYTRQFARQEGARLFDGSA